MTWSAVIDELVKDHALTHLALNDPLTGLPNRVLFADRLAQAVARATRSSTRGRRAPKLLVMFIDLEGLEAVHDRHGHLAGDAVLVEAARRLLEQVRGTDTIARLGDDEFAVLCEGVQRADDGLALARRLSAALAAPYAIEGDVARLSAAVGIAVAHPRVEDIGALLRRADAARETAKREGPGRVALSERP